MSKDMNNIDNIPDELKALKQWVCWNSTKFPINARTGNKAEVDNPDTWCTFEEARRAVLSGKYKGAGFVLTKDDPYVIIDLDHVIDPDTGEILPWAQTIIDRMDSYTEVSQSGTGIHIIIKGKKPGDKCRRGDTEIYDCKRYFALTGNLLGNRGIIEDCQEQLDALYAETLGKDDGDNEALELEFVDGSDSRSIDEKFNNLIEREVVLETYERRRTDKRFPSDSEYDQALANYARAADFTYEEAVDLIKTSWCKHGLDKSDEREKKMLRKDYWERTIGKADAWVKKSKVKSSSIAERLVKIGQDWELFHTHDKTAYAVIKQENHSEVHPLGEHKCRLAKHFLSDAYHEKTGKIPNEQAIQSALTILRGTAILHNREAAIYKRIAGHNGKVYIDLSDPDWSVVEVTKEGWKVILDSPVRFLRSDASLPLPIPQTGGNMDDFRSVVNFTDEDWPLVVGWILGAFNPRGPYPCLFFHSPHGTAKTETMRMILKVTDPSDDPSLDCLRAPPRDERTLAVCSFNSRVLAFDNVSSISERMSDAFCRLSTGGSTPQRQNYTDTDQVPFVASRPFMISSVVDAITRSDLLDRVILVRPPRLSITIPEEKLRKELMRLRPQILGKLLDAVSQAMRNKDSVDIVMPRMADFTKWVYAGISALGVDPNAFLDVYRENIASIHSLALDSPLARLIYKFAVEHPADDRWVGTATNLLQRLHDMADMALVGSKEWPSIPSKLSNFLNRLINEFRAVGVHIESAHGRIRRTTIWWEKEDDN